MDTFGRPGSRGEEKTPACRQVGSAAAVLRLPQLQSAHYCLSLRRPQNLQPARVERWCLAPHPGFLPTSLLHRAWGCWLVRPERTGHHSWRAKQHLTLHLFWWAAVVLVVATMVARHRNIFDCTSNSLCFLLQMNRQKTSQAGRGALLHQSLDFSLSAKQRIQTPTMSSLLQTKNIYNLSKLSSGRAIQTVSSTS